MLPVIDSFIALLHVCTNEHCLLAGSLSPFCSSTVSLSVPCFSWGSLLQSCDCFLLHVLILEPPVAYSAQPCCFKAHTYTTRYFRLSHYCNILLVLFRLLQSLPLQWHIQVTVVLWFSCLGWLLVYADDWAVYFEFFSIASSGTNVLIIICKYPCCNTQKFLINT